MHFTGLKISKMTPIKNELKNRSIQQRSSSIFSVMYQIGNKHLYSSTFKLVSSCNQLPIETRHHVRPSRRLPSTKVNIPTDQLNNKNNEEINDIEEDDYNEQDIISEKLLKIANNKKLKVNNETSNKIISHKKHLTSNSLSKEVSTQSKINDLEEKSIYYRKKLEFAISQANKEKSGKIAVKLATIEGEKKYLQSLLINKTEQQNIDLNNQYNENNINNFSFEKKI